MTAIDETPRTTAAYRYTTETGALLYEVLRLEPKTFRQRRPDGNGGWAWNLDATPRVPYRLPQLASVANLGGCCFIVEGEKDADRIAQALRLDAGVLTAAVTTNAGGSAWRWPAEWAEHFRGFETVYVIADNDEPGRRAARERAELVRTVCPDVRLQMALPDVGDKGDVTDYLDNGNTIDDLWRLVEGAPNVHPADTTNNDTTPTGDDATGEPPAPQLEILWAHEHAQAVDSAPPVGWLVRGLWPADSHGVIAAEQKAGKTWANLDLAVSVASGTPWMGVHPVDTQGPVLLFLGEGGKRKMLRRLRAICEHRGVRYEDLPIRLCFKVPHLTSLLHLAAIAEEVHASRPALVVVDPLYLAARGAKTSQLNEMGEHLENLQHVATSHGAALAVIHHWNKTGEGKGAKRMTGVGGAEWGRVLVSVGVITKHTDKVTKETNVVLEWDFEGDEIPDTTVRIKRRVWVDDPDDLASPMHYQLGLVEDDPEEQQQYPNLTASARRVVGVLAKEADWITVQAIGDDLADAGHPLKKRTIQTALKEIVEAGIARPSGDPGTAFKWRINEN